MAELVRLSDVAAINPRLRTALAPDEEVSFAGMADMSEVSGSLRTPSIRPFAEVAKGFTPFERDDLLIAKITPCFENGKIGTASIPTRIGFGSTEFHVVRPDPKKLDAGYLRHLLRAPRFRKAGELRMTGSGGQRRVPTDYVASTLVPLPPLDEQRRIAAILNKADELRAKRREALAHLDIHAQSIFYDMFGKLDRSHVLSGAISGLVGGRNLVGPDTGSNKYRVLKVSAVTSGQYLEEEAKPLPAGYEPPPEHVVRIGDVIISRANTTELVGASALVEKTNETTVLPDKLWRAVPSSRVIPRYLLAALQSEETRAEISRRSSGSGGSMKNISKPKLLSVPIALPSLELQRTFATRVAAVERLKHHHRTQLAQLDTLFASLQHRAFKGEL